jgi:hypothetical protein
MHRENEMSNQQFEIFSFTNHKLLWSARHSSYHEVQMVHESECLKQKILSSPWPLFGIIFEVFC